MPRKNSALNTMDKNENGTTNAKGNTFFNSPRRTTIPKFLKDIYENIFHEKLTARSLVKQITALRRKELSLLKKEELSLLKRGVNIHKYYLYNIIPEKRDRDDTITISLSQTIGLETLSKEFTGESKGSAAIKKAIAKLCYLKTEYPASHPGKNSVVAPLNIKGNKEWAKKHYSEILQQLEGLNKCIDLFGGSGFLTLLVAEQYPQCSCIYNDDDRDKQNFFECLRKTPDKLMASCRILLNYGMITPLNNAEKKDKNIQAAIFWFNTFNQGKNHPKAAKVLEQLYYLSEIVNRNVKLSEQEALNCLNSHMHEPDALIIADSPYLFSSGYEDRNTAGTREFGLDKFIELSKMLLIVESIFILPCRLTGPKDFSKSPTEQNTRMDKYIRGEIEDLFMDKGLFYKKIPYRGNGTIECIISNFHFNGFEPFTS